MNRLKWVIALALMLVVGAAGVRVFALRRAAATSTEARYLTHVAAHGDLTAIVSGSGNLVPIDSRQLKSPAASDVATVMASEGEALVRGQAIMGLTSDAVVNAYNQARLDLENAMAAYEAALRPADRDVTAAALKVEQARLAVADKEAAVAGLIVTAPMAGTVQDVKVVPGQTVSAGAQLLTVVDDSLEFSIVVPVGQYDAKFMAVGLPAVVQVDAVGSSSPGRVTVVGQEVAVSGKITGINVTVSFTGVPGTLAGMTGNATITCENGYNVVGHGTVAPRTRTDVRTVAGGTVVSVAAAGAHVGAGGVAATLSNPSLHLQLDQARSELASAEAAYIELSIDRGSLAQVRTLELKVIQARQALERARADRDGLQVVSPIDGLLLKRPVTVGEAVTKGQTVATVGDCTKMLFNIAVDELDLSRISIGQRVQVGVAAFPRKVYDGFVHAIATEGTVRDGIATFTVTIAVNNPGELRVGLTATADVIVGEARNALLVPNEAVVIRDSATTVRVIGADGVVRSVPVTIGLAGDTMTHITSGLTPGANVIVATIRSQTTATTGFNLGGAGRVLGPGGR